MASEPIYVEAPLYGAKVIDAVFVPDIKYRDKDGVWLIEFDTGATREIRTKAGYFNRSADFIGKDMYDSERLARRADIRHEYDQSTPRRPLAPRRAAHWGPACQ